MPSTFTPVPALVGGVLMGVAAGAMWLAYGRVAGIAGIFAGLLRRRDGDTGWRLAFVLGLLAGACALASVKPHWFDAQAPHAWPVLAVSGVLVGFGTRMANGCTTGHGICGTSRLSIRSITATLVFMALGISVASVIGGMLP
jgi:uncharacterized membrane protein YedE/YeeE